MGLLDNVTVGGLLRFFMRRAIEGVVILVILYYLPNIPPFCKFGTPYKLAETMQLDGKLAVNEKLANAESWHLNNVHGAESFATFNGELFTGLATGEIVKLTGDKHISPITTFGKPCEFFEEAKCGRPLGMTFDESGSLYVADAYHGIFKVNVQTGEKLQLVSPDDEIDGTKAMIFNSIAVSKSGEIYWTDSSTEFQLLDGVFDLLADGSGRMLKYDPKTKRNTVLMDNLHFANGIALTRNEDALLVAETSKSLLNKYHLKGDKAGQHEVLMEGLPGIPDNIQSDGRGGFFVPLVMSHDRLLPNLFQIVRPFPWIRKLVARGFGLLELTFKAMDYVYANDIAKIGVHMVGHFSLPLRHMQLNQRTTIMQINENGEIIDSFHTTNGKLSAISEAFIFNDYLLLGSPCNNYIGRIPLKDVGLSTPKPTPTTTTTPKPPTPAPTKAPTPTPQTTPKPTTPSKEQQSKEAEKTTVKPVTTTPKPPNNIKQETSSQKASKSKNEL